MDCLKYILRDCIHSDKTIIFRLLKAGFASECYNGRGLTSLAEQRPQVCPYALLVDSSAIYRNHSPLDYIYTDILPADAISRLKSGTKRDKGFDNARKRVEDPENED